MRHGRQIENIRFGVLLVLLGACFMLGGASRLDVLSLILLQPVAVLCLLGFLLTPAPIEWATVRTPLLLLAGLAGVMAAQLVPLPPSVWTNLPGQAAFAASATSAGLEQPWRPISLAPDLTMASLVGLIVPFAVLVGLASIEQRRRLTLLTALLVGIGASALFGLAQVSGGPRSPFYLYSVTNLEDAVGLFSNRNHQAVLITMAWPMLVVWSMMPRRDARRAAAARWIAVGFSLFLLPLLLVTGSRAGLALGGVSLVCAAALWWRSRGTEKRPQGPFDRFLVPVAVAGGGLIILVATVVMSRAEALQRLLTVAASEDTRVEATPVLLEMARDFFPIGSGFGSFDPVYRFYEPLELLSTKYLNHAHNDLLELVITGGAPGILLLAIFLIWFGKQALRAWLSRDAHQDVALALVASVMILLALLSSLVDYPLRTPLMAAILAIACGWLAAPTTAGRQVSGTG